MVEENSVNLSEKDPKIYEIGYLLVPFVAEEAKDEMIRRELVSVIEANGGKIVSEMTPALRKLAYPIRKMIDNKYSQFKDAYFGTIRFEAVPIRAEAINQGLRKSDNIMRFLLIEAPKPSKAKLPAVGILGGKKDANSKDKLSEVELAPADKQAIDKEIDDLLIAAQ